MPILPIAQDAVTDQAQLLSAVIDTAGNVIVGLRADHTIFAWNRAAEQLYQTPREQAFNVDYVATFIAAEHRDAVAADIQAVLAGKVTHNFEDDSILPDGARRTLLWNVTRVLDPNGQPFGIVAIGQDITERKEAEERFRLVFEYVQDGLLLSDASGVIDCNPAALAMLGLTEKAQLIGRRPAEFSPPVQPDGTDSLSKSRDLGAQTAARGALTFEWVHARADGTSLPVEVAVRHAMLAGRRISVVAWHDLSRQRALAEERAQLAQRLELVQKMEAVGQLAGGVAHDFNNLLTAMRNAIELAQLALPEDAPAQDDLDLAQEAAQRASGLTRQLLAFSRQQAVRVDAVDLADLVRATMPLLCTSIAPTVRVETHVPAGSAIVSADRSQLEQVVMNLVLNARDAMPDGGTLSVSLRREEATRSFVLEVADTGTGMDAATQRRIFEPFFTTKPLGEGTGLGLSVVYGAVLQAGGQVAVESAVGQGSRFTVTLPMGEPVSTPTASATIQMEGNGRLVLLVEDEPAVRQTTQRLLERLGWRVETAVDGQAGWELFEARRAEVSIVLTDVRMPRLDGVRLAQRIRGTVPNFPILIFSGFDSVEGGSSATVADVPFLSKPFDLRQLAAALREALPTVA